MEALEEGGELGRGVNSPTVWEEKGAWQGLDATK